MIAVTKFPERFMVKSRFTASIKKTYAKALVELFKRVGL
jgi:hypothetical protein